SDRQKYLVFYQIWTLKEAYGKATGQGIANILDVVDVSPLLVSMGKNLQIESWTLELLNSEIDLNYAAAICVSNQEL
ncbi:MAG: 4'-phosphopantetheinyl transferase superfamily protein, partial [Pseudanabaena sp. ELA748]